ncbi:MAG: hypothetical protein H0X51_06350 [Parachlamydiaceae bacterium]|nr:hypothetical protein [Parachlamydiaceae bacterium]
MDTPKKSLKLKLFLWIGLSLFLLLAISIALLPTVASTEWGKQQIVKLINQRIDGTVSIEKVNLSWFGKQVIENLILKDPSKTIVAHLEGMEIEASILQLMFGEFPQGPLAVNGFNLLLIEQKDGFTNLHDALGRSHFPHPLHNPAESGQNFPIKIALLDMSASVQALPDQQISLQIKGQTQHDQVRGDISVDATLVKNASAPLQLQPLHANVEVNNFPVALVDHLFSLQNPQLAGLLRALLGESFNATIQQKFQNDDVQFQIDAHSQQFTTTLIGKVEADTLFLTHQATTSLTIEPELFHRLADLAGHPAIQMEQPTQADIIVEQLELPLAFFQEGSSTNRKPILIAHFNLAPTSLISPALKIPLKLEQLSASIQAIESSSLISLILDGKASQASNPIQVKLNASTDTSPHFKQLLANLTEHSQVNLEAKGAPLAIIDRLLGLPQRLEQALGTEATLHASAQIHQGIADVDLSVETAKLAINHLPLTIDDQVRLTAPTTIQYRLDPDFINNLGSGSPKSVKLLNQTWVELQINQLQFPFKGTGASLIDAEALLQPFTLSNLPSQVGNVSLSDVRASLNGNLLTKINVLLDAKIQVPSTTKFGVILDGSAQIQTQAIVRKQNNSWDLIIDKANIITSQGSLRATAQLSESKYFQLAAPLVIDYHVTPSMVSALSDRKIQLSKPALVHFTLQPFTTPLNIADILAQNFSALHTTGFLQIDELALNYAETPSIQSLTLPFNLDGPSNQLISSIKGQAQGGLLDSNLLLTQWLDKEGQLNVEQMQTRASLHLSNWPAATVAALTGQPDLIELIGKTIDIQLQTTLATYQPLNGTASFKIQGHQLYGEGAVHLGERITLQDPDRPISFRSTITPQRFQIIRSYFNKQTDSLHLVQAAELTANIRNLNIPRTRSLLQAALDATVNIDKLIVADATQQALAIENIALQIKGQQAAKTLLFSLQADDKSDRSIVNPIVLKGSLENYVNANGALNKQDLSFNMQASSRALPIGHLCQVFCVNPTLRQKVESVFGKSVDTEMQIQLQHMSGPVRVQLKGANGWLNLDGKLQGTQLTLNKPFEFEVTVTPQLGKAVLQDLLPILSGVLHAEKPLKVTIDPNGFLLPLNAKDISEIQIGKATLELGKMTFSNEGQLGSVFNLLRPSNKEPLSVWFTPLFVQMNEGKIKIARMDFLMLNRYPMAVWGRINVPRDTVEMRIGITGTALYESFGIKGLGSDQMLQIPLTGSLNHASIDRAKATARISALVAQDQGSSAGLVIGTVLNIAGGGLTEDKVPAATTNPLPWGPLKSEASESTKQAEAVTESKHHHSARKKSKHDTGAQIKDAASSLLNSLLH